MGHTLYTVICKIRMLLNFIPHSYCQTHTKTKENNDIDQMKETNLDSGRSSSLVWSRYLAKKCCKSSVHLILHGD